MRPAKYPQMTVILGEKPCNMGLPTLHVITSGWPITSCLSSWPITFHTGACVVTRIQRACWRHILITSCDLQGVRDPAYPLPLLYCVFTPACVIPPSLLRQFGYGLSLCDRRYVNIHSYSFLCMDATTPQGRVWEVEAPIGEMDAGLAVGAEDVLFRLLKYVSA